MSRAYQASLERAKVFLVCRMLHDYGRWGLSAAEWKIITHLRRLGPSTHESTKSMHVDVHRALIALVSLGIPIPILRILNSDIFRVRNSEYLPISDKMDFFPKIPLLRLLAAMDALVFRLSALSSLLSYRLPTS